MQPGIDYPAVTVSYFCHDGNGRFLFNLRGQNSRDEPSASTQCLSYCKAQKRAANDSSLVDV